jgi:alpha-mannosidase
MPVFEECCVLIPTATLEDFPSDLSDYDARSTLAAWTVLWHPQLLATTGQLPTWVRADSPPEPKPGTLIVAPAPSLVQLPADFQTRVQECEGCYLVTGGSRSELLGNIDRLGSGEGQASRQDPQPIRNEDRQVAVEDFYAAGYASLQIQVMTRRLRYTSNLDEIHLQNRMIDAAKNFLNGNAENSIAALHDVFDCLAEERDHYFSSSDPHLIDLTLVSASTIDDMLDEMDAVHSSEDSDSALHTSHNLLIDQDIAEAINKMPEARVQNFRRLIAEKKVGWAGGGPSVSTCLDTMTLSQAEQSIAAVTDACQQAVGSRPQVFGRFSGGWSGDMTWVLGKLGYTGIIPLDFAAGTGQGDEAKLLVETGVGQLEALTAKPIDASSDSEFLNLGPRLGEAIDSGEIATALFAHWPGKGCDSFADVRRAATWSLCLGRFWRIEEYFSEGEHPYHHGTIPATSESAAGLLDSIVRSGQPDPISKLACQFVETVRTEQQTMVSGLADLIAGGKSGEGDPVQQFVNAVVGDRSAVQPTAIQTMLINSASTGRRETVNVSHPIASEAKHIFATSQEGSATEVTVDIPACGFVMLGGDGSSQPKSKSLKQRLRGKFGGGSRSIANKERSDGSVRLQNEFMEAVISSSTGGISGVYSGSVRGNRFSMKLIYHHTEVVGEPSETIMQCESIEVGQSSTAAGTANVTGSLADAKTQRVLAKFDLEYRLDRGSRVLQLVGKLTPSDRLRGAPWKNYFAARSAVAGESAIYWPIIRDKMHRRTSRRFVAPLGVVIDEAERQTLVAAHGLAFHRQVSDRFVDTLLLVENESQHSFKLDYGFDIPSPVATARSLIAPPISTSLSATQSAAKIGWMIHVAPKSLLVSSLVVDRRSDGRLAASLRLTQTRSQPCKAIVRFLRDVDAAILIDQPCSNTLNQSIPDANDSNRLESKGDRVSLSMAGHTVADLLVVFEQADPE